MNTHRLVGAASLIVTGLAVASPALAHIDPDPTDAQAGSEVPVGFTVQHGCDGSPTVRLDMRLPDGVRAPAAEAPDGWTGRVQGNVVTFEGGPLPDDQELTFRVRMILPATPETTIYFPFVQRCEVGETRWIDIPSGGSSTALGEPAPAMRLIGPTAITQPTQPITVASTSPTVPIGPTSTTTTLLDPPGPASSTTLAGVDPTATTSTEVDRYYGDGGSRSTGTVVFVASIAAMAAMAGIVITKSRRGRR